jgi:hypothetical protein
MKRLALTLLVALAGCPSFDFDHGLFACSIDDDCDPARGEICHYGTCQARPDGGAGEDAGAADAGACLSNGASCTLADQCCSLKCEVASGLCVL